MSTQREEFRRWGVMADWARPYLTNSPDYVNTQLDMFLRLYQAGHIFRWGVELLNFNFSRRFHNIHNNVAHGLVKVRLINTNHLTNELY